MSDRLAEIEARLRAAAPWTVETPEYNTLIAHAPTDLRDLLAVAKAAVPVLREWLPHSGMCVAEEYGPNREVLPPRCRCAPEAQALRAALANLEGGPR